MFDSQNLGDTTRATKEADWIAFFSERRILTFLLVSCGPIPMALITAALFAFGEPKPPTLELIPFSAAILLALTVWVAWRSSRWNERGIRTYRAGRSLWLFVWIGPAPALLTFLFVTVSSGGGWGGLPQALAGIVLSCGFLLVAVHVAAIWALVGMYQAVDDITGERPEELLDTP